MHEFWFMFSNEVSRIRKHKASLAPPGGSWSRHAREWKINANVLTSQLRVKKNLLGQISGEKYKWVEASVEFEEGDRFRNVDGKLVPDFPGGSWIYAAKNYKLNGNILTADLKTIQGEWRTQTIVIEKGAEYKNSGGEFTFEAYKNSTDFRITLKNRARAVAIAKHVTLENNLFYVIDVFSDTEECWRITRRYREFDALRKNLEYILKPQNIDIPESLPPKTLFRSSTKTIESRKKKLCQFLNTLITHPIINQLEEVQLFLTQDAQCVKAVASLSEDEEFLEEEFSLKSGSEEGFTPDYDGPFEPLDQELNSLLKHKTFEQFDHLDESVEAIFFDKDQEPFMDRLTSSTFNPFDAFSPTAPKNNVICISQTSEPPLPPPNIVQAKQILNKIEKPICNNNNNEAAVEHDPYDDLISISDVEDNLKNRELPSIPPQRQSTSQNQIQSQNHSYHSQKSPPCLPSKPPPSLPSDQPPLFPSNVPPSLPFTSPHKFSSTIRQNLRKTNSLKQEENEILASLETQIIEDYSATQKQIKFESFSPSSFATPELNGKIASSSPIILKNEERDKLNMIKERKTTTTKEIKELFSTRSANEEKNYDNVQIRSKIKKETKFQPHYYRQLRSATSHNSFASSTGRRTPQSPIPKEIHLENEILYLSEEASLI